jgi:hypothetical protein
MENSSREQFRTHVLMHALAASCEELCAKTGNPPLLVAHVNFSKYAF